MKKIGFTVITTLVMVLIFSCEQAVTGTNSPGVQQYTTDGRPLVSLTIPSPKARALTLDLAKGGADFYEVAFNDGTTTYRSIWNFGETGKIMVPPGTYDTADEAILFSGDSKNKTLLAVGLLTAVDSTSGAAIKIDTKEITFTLVPLTNDINIDATKNTFKITAPAGYETAATGTLKSATFTAPTGKPMPVPVFLLPKDSTSAITATYTFDIGASVLSNYASGIIVTALGTASSVGISSAEADGPVTVTATVTAPAAGQPLSDGDIDLTIDTPDNDGLSRLAINIPVNAINSTANPVTWYIRGGLSNGNLDGGATANSVGGAVLLGVGSVTSGAMTIVTP